MKNIISKLKKNKWKIIIALIIVIGAIKVCGVYSAEFVYKDVPWVHNYLVVDEIFTSILRGIGEVFYFLLAFIVDGMFDVFTALANWNVLEMLSVQTLLTKIDTYIYSFLFIIFIVAIGAKMFKLEIFKLFTNIIITMIAIVCFSTFLTLASNFKTALMNDTDTIIGKGDYKVSEMLLVNNSVDLVKSMRNGEVTHPNADKVAYIDINERMTKDIIIDYPSVNADTDEIEYQNLANGLWGVGDTRYYRYYVNYLEINVTLFSLVIVYFFAIFKMAFLIGEWLVINIFGKFTLGKGFFNYENLSVVFKGVVQNVSAQAIVYALMMVFSIIVADIVASTLPFLGKCIFIYAFGMVILMGSQFITSVMGVNDGSMRAIGALFATQRMARAFGRGTSGFRQRVKQSKQKAGELGGKLGDKYGEKFSDKVADELADNMEHNEKFKDTLGQVGKDVDVEHAKEKMQEKEYQGNVNHKASEELYGKDYKVKQEKDKIVASEEKGQNQDKAMQELYGKDYKVKQEKDKIKSSEEKGKNQDQAMQELYGKDYKVKQEKDKIKSSEEKGQNQDKAMQELYGKDYKVKQEKDKIVANEQKEVVTDKAMQELYGKDHKVKNEEKQIKKREEHAKVNDVAMKNLHGKDYKDIIREGKAKEQAKYYQEIERQKVLLKQPSKDPKNKAVYEQSSKKEKEQEDIEISNYEWWKD